MSDGSRSSIDSVLAVIFIFLLAIKAQKGGRLRKAEGSASRNYQSNCKDYLYSSSNPSIKPAKRIDNGFTARNHSSRHVNKDYSEPSIGSNSWRCRCNPQHIKLNRETLEINHQTDHPAIIVHFRTTKHVKS